jgi:hypothetical protein
MLECPQHAGCGSRHRARQIDILDAHQPTAVIGARIEVAGGGRE